jgi:hypothetical protein
VKTGGTESPPGRFAVLIGINPSAAKPDKLRHETGKAEKAEEIRALKMSGSHFRPLVGTAVVAVLLSLTVGAVAKDGKGGGGGSGGDNNNYNTVIRDIARLNEALQGDNVVGYGHGGGSDSYEGHPPPWLSLHKPSQRDAYCREKHPSYNAATGTYTTYAGHQRRCNLP